MKKSICSVIATILTFCAYAQEIKIKNDEVKLDEKVVAYIEGKKPNFQISNLDKQYVVNAELKFLESSGKRWMVLKSAATGKTNEVEYKKFNPLNQQKSLIEAFIDKGFLSAEGINPEAIENYINGEATGVSAKIKDEANAAIEKKKRIENYKIAIDDSGNIFSVTSKDPNSTRIGTIKIAATTSAGIQKYEVFDLDNYLIATWYNMSSKHAGYDKFLYEELITFDQKVIKIKYDSFGTLQYKMSSDKTALNIVGELLDNGYSLQHQGIAAEKAIKQQKLAADQENLAKEKELANKIYEQKPFAMDSKKVIRVIEYALEASSLGQCTSHDAAYILENNKITGKKYPVKGTSLYSNYEIKLNTENGLIKNASYITQNANYPILLEFQNDNIVRVLIKNDGIDYKFKYESDKVTILSKEDSSEITYVLELIGEKTKTITKTIKLDKPFSKPFVSKISKLSYADDSNNTFTLDYTSYKNEKTSILQRFIYKFSKVSNTIYTVDYLDNGIKDDISNGLKVTYTYDNFDRISQQDNIYKNSQSISNYYYVDNKNFNFSKKITKVDFPKEKATYIDIPADLAKTNDNQNDYEWKHGQYRLDVNNNLYLEIRDGKIREKTNGVWSAWRSQEM